MIPASFWHGLTRHPNIAQILTDPAECWVYGTDNSKQQAAPEAVFFPTQADAVQAIVRQCATHQIPLTVRGRGTGTVGGAVPSLGGVVLCFERMDKIQALNAADRFLITEPGVLNTAAQQAAREKGFFWAPDPSSQDYCTVGGNLAHNAAGPRAIKYGTCRENTLGLVAVDGLGNLFHTGVHTTKGVVGYDLTRLLIGSEGTLGIIVEATLKLLPLPEGIATLQAFYSTVDEAAQAVMTIMQSPLTPCTLEMLDGAALALIRQAHPELSIPEQAQAMLLIEVDGAKKALPDSLQSLIQLAQNTGLIQAYPARTEVERKSVWAARKALSPALRTIAPGKLNEDVVVPISQLTNFIHFTHTLSQQHQLPIVNFGHAGNGNLHVNILFSEEQRDTAFQCLARVFEKVLELGGTLSGEHGIGLQKKAFIADEIDLTAFQHMQALKRVFDPQGILNPGKWI